MFYSTTDLPVVNGHAIYIDSEWALTSISQRQFWRGYDLERTATGASRGSSPSTSPTGTQPGRRLGKIAMRVHARRGHRRGLGAAQATTSTTALDDANVVRAGSSTRRSSSPTRPGATNLEPLLVNTAGSWARPPRRGDAHPQPLPRRRLRAHAHRPGDDGGRQRGGAARGQRDPRRDRLARRAVPDLAAARAGRLRAARALDRIRWKLFKRAAKPPLRVTEDGGLEATGPLAAGLVRAGPLVRRLFG